MEKSKAKVTIASLVYSMIKDGKSNEVIIKAIKKKFPESKISEAHMNWYRNQLTSKDKPKAKKDKPVEKKEEEEDDDIDDDEDEDEDEVEDDEEDDEEDDKD